MEASCYNLRSTRREEALISVQLQLVSEEDFVTQSLGSRHPASRQVSFSNNSSSTSDLDLDISQLQNSDRELGVSHSVHTVLSVLVKMLV